MCDKDVIMKSLCNTTTMVELEGNKHVELFSHVIFISLISRRWNTQTKFKILIEDPQLVGPLFIYVELMYSGDSFQKDIFLYWEAEGAQVNDFQQKQRLS